MIYVVDEKEVNVLKDGTLKLTQEDSVKVCVKDATKPVFTADDVQNFIALSKDMAIELINVASKETLAFIVGGFVFGGDECTLVHISMAIPAGYEDKIHILEEGKKPQKVRKPRTRKTQAAASTPEASAKDTVAPTSKTQVQTPVAETTTTSVAGAMNPPVEGNITVEDAPASGDDSTV